MKKANISKAQKKIMRVRVKKIMDTIKNNSKLRFVYVLRGSIKNSKEMSLDEQGNPDIDIDIQMKMLKKFENPNEAYNHIHSELKLALKDHEIINSHNRTIKIKRPEFTIDIAIVDPFTELGKKYALTNDKGVFQWSQDKKH